MRRWESGVFSLLYRMLEWRWYPTRFTKSDVRLVYENYRLTICGVYVSKDGRGVLAICAGDPEHARRIHEELGGTLFLIRSGEDCPDGYRRRGRLCELRNTRA